MHKTLLIAILSVCLIPALSTNARETTNTSIPVAGKTTGGNQQLFFTENTGQIIDQHGKHRNDIDYKLDADGMTMFIGDGQIHYQWSKSVGDVHTLPANTLSPSRQGRTNSKTENYRIDVQLIGANKNAQAIAEGQQPYYETYYLSQCAKGTTAHSYTKVTYKNIYPNIDWVVYVTASPKGKNINESVSSNTSLSGVGGFLKYDFIIHPGGNPDNIRLQYNGAISLQLKDGNLTAETQLGSITENAPYSYYADTKEKVSSSFKLDGNILSYNIPKSLITGSQSLIIDPTLKWATYYYEYNSHPNRTLPGTVATALVTDKDYNVYMHGAGGNSNLATSGAVRSTTDGCSSFIVKFDKDGQRVWGTFYGDFGGPSYSHGIACDSRNNIYVCGWGGGGQEIPIPGPYRNTASLNTTSYIVKFNSSGAIQWTDLHPGELMAIACDPADNIYTAGTYRDTGIATSSSHQRVYSGANDAILAKFDSDGNRIWCTYYGGAGSDQGYAVSCDANAHVYLGGNTTSADSISTPGSHSTTYAGTGIYPDGFLVQFDSSGARQWGTYYGSASTQISSLACNSSGDVYIAGNTDGGLISTTGVYQPTLAGSTDCFIAKFNSSGVRQWGSYFGGSGHEFYASVAVSAAGKPYLAGVTYSSSGIATANGYQITYGGGTSDNFIAEFTPAGNVTWATYYGGTGDELDYSHTMIPSVPLACSKDGRMYMAYVTKSAGLATTGAFQTTGATSSFDASAYLTCFLADTLSYITLPYNDTLYCAGDSIRVPYGVTDQFRRTNTFTLQLSDAAGSFNTPVNLGIRADSIAGIIRGRIPPNTSGGTGYKIRIISNAPSSISYNYEKVHDIHIKPAPLNFSMGSNSPVCEADTIRFTGNTATPLTGVKWDWTGPAGFTDTLKNPKRGPATSAMAGYYKLKATLLADACALTDSVLVTIKPLPAKPTAGSNSPVCFGNTLSLTATGTTSGVSYAWTGPNSFTSTSQNPSRSPATVADSGRYIVTTTLNGCIAKDTETVMVYPQIPVPVASSNSPVCVGSDINLRVASIPGATYAWMGPSYTAATQNPSIAGAVLTNSGTYIVTATVNGCPSDAGTTAVTVAQGPVVFAYPSPGNNICPGKNLTLNVRLTGTAMGPTYQWQKNGVNIPAATSATYIDNTTADGDKYSVVYTPGIGSTCTTPIRSNDITITVLPWKAPAVSITATDSNAWPGLLINFTATATDAGAIPKYQWKLNNNNVIGALSNVWGAATLNNGDNVCIEVTSTYMCPQPTTATTCKIVKIATGIHDVPGSNINIYPNPATDVVTIEGITTETTIQLYDVHGKLIHTTTATRPKTSLNTATLAPGNYTLLLTDVNGLKNSYKLVKE